MNKECIEYGDPLPERRWSFSMRIMGFSKKWDKLTNPEFTTFRFPRKDRDWAENEVVQIVYKPRSKDREILGIAQVMRKETRQLADITHEEAVEDGFINLHQMFEFLSKNSNKWLQPINKLILRWL